MAGLVFGVPIDVAFMRTIPGNEDRYTFSPQEMGKAAHERQNYEGKQTMCKNALVRLQKEYGGDGSAMCMIYNATGTDLTYHLSHEWHGHVYKKPFPSVIMNGQWGAWLHVPKSDSTCGSSAAVIYESRPSYPGFPHDWLQSWEIQPMINNNQVHAEVRSSGGFYNPDWCHLHSLLTPDKSASEYGGYTTAATIGNGNSAIFSGIMFTIPEWRN